MTPFEQRLQAFYDQNRNKDGVSAMIAYLAPVEKSPHVIVVGDKPSFVETRFYAVPDGANPHQAIDEFTQRGRPVVMAFDLKSRKSLYDQFDRWAIGDISDGSALHRRPAIYLPPRECYESRYETAARQQADRRAARPVLRLASVNGLTLG